MSKRVTLTNHEMEFITDLVENAVKYKFQNNPEDKFLVSHTGDLINKLKAAFPVKEKKDE